MVSLMELLDKTMHFRIDCRDHHEFGLFASSKNSTGL
jgi:hypothetical protein